MSATFTTMYKNFMLLYSTNSNICYWQNLLLDGIKKQKQTNQQTNKGPNKQKTNGKNKKKQINKRTNKNKQISKQTKRKDTFRFHRRCRCCEVSAEYESESETGLATPGIRQPLYLTHRQCKPMQGTIQSPFKPMKFDTIFLISPPYKMQIRNIRNLLCKRVASVALCVLSKPFLSSIRLLELLGGSFYTSLEWRNG